MSCRGVIVPFCRSDWNVINQKTGNSSTPLHMAVTNYGGKHLPIIEARLVRV